MANEEEKPKVDNRPVIVQWLERDKAKEKDKRERYTGILTKIKDNRPLEKRLFNAKPAK